MNRRSLIKSLFTISVAPKIVAELDIKPPMVSPVTPPVGLVSQLQFVNPSWLPELITKYGQDTDDFVKIMDNMGQSHDLHTGDKITFTFHNKPKYIEDGE